MKSRFSSVIGRDALRFAAQSIDAAIDIETIRVRACSKYDPSERAHLLLTGEPGKRLSNVDFRIVGDRPPAPSDRSKAGILSHLRALILPACYQAEGALETYCVALDIHEPAETAGHLAELARTHPEAVASLLRLDSVSAARALLTEPWESIRTLVVEMEKIRIAFVLRTIAEEMGDLLHDPYRWDSFRQGLSGGPRLSFPFRQIEYETKILERVLFLYLRNRRDWRPPAGLRPKRGNIADFLSRPILNRPTSKREALFLRDTELESIGRSLLEDWREEHGEELEDRLEMKLLSSLRRLEKLEGDIEKHRADYGTKGLAANAGPVPPLLRLMIAARFAVAWCRTPPSEADHAKDASDNVGWLERQAPIEMAIRSLARSENTICKVEPHFHLAGPARLAFTVLRYIFVDDANMVPAHLRREFGMAIRSQADAERSLGRRFGFDELMPRGEDTKVAPMEIDKAYNEVFDGRPLSELPLEQYAIIKPMVARFDPK